MDQRIGQNANDSTYTTNSETAYVSFHPTLKLGLFADESYISNLSGYFYQALVNTGSGAPPVELGTGSHSTTFGGGANYQFTKDLSGVAQATYYDQAYLGNSLPGTYVSGTLNYGRRLWDLFTFSGSVIESSNGLGSNGLGFIANVNYYHRFGLWETSGSVQLRAERAIVPDYVHNVVLQLQRKHTPAVLANGAVDGGV